MKIALFIFIDFLIVLSLVTIIVFGRLWFLNRNKHSAAPKNIESFKNENLYDEAMVEQERLAHIDEPAVTVTTTNPDICFMEDSCYINPESDLKQGNDDCIQKRQTLSEKITQH